MSTTIATGHDKKHNRDQAQDQEGRNRYKSMSMQRFTMDSQQPKRLDSVIGGDVWQLVNTMKLFHCDSVIANSESIATRLGNNN